ncbi:MAG TPA: SDR family oxidoreductase [Burkholderiales bacterium]|nr:SDR family oxidoreductase [Burkholderiales bacterium]
MELGLADKVVLITGGSKGIGLSCARAFLDEGAKVALVSRAQSNLDAAVAKLAAPKGRVLTVAADLKQAEAAAAAVAKVDSELGAIEVVVNSAGAAKRYLPAELTAASWHDAMDAKYFTYIHTLDAVLPRMAARGGGAVVNIIGLGGKIATPIHLPGGAANSALMLTTVGLANVYGPKGIRINAINPAATMTDRVQEALRLEAKTKGVSEQEVLAQGQAKVPLGRYASPEDIAYLTVFLASDKASYITGAIVPMDGGANPVL